MQPDRSCQWEHCRYWPGDQQNGPTKPGKMHMVVDIKCLFRDYICKQLKDFQIKKKTYEFMYLNTVCMFESKMHFSLNNIVVKGSSN